MVSFIVQPLTGEDRDFLAAFLFEHWGADYVVSRGRIHHARDLKGFAAVLPQGARVGVITYRFDREGCEIVSLDSLIPDSGIGSALLNEVVETARRAGANRVWLITTNDNLNALRFYQKRRFRLAAVYPGAIETSRRLKPGIPEIGEHGIPIRDEIELERVW